jgi:hypothetical protein
LPGPRPRAGGTRWERWDEPWPQLLDRGAGAIRDGVVRVAEAQCRAQRVPPVTEVFALVLTCVAQGSLQVSPHLVSGEGPIHMDEDEVDGALDWRPTLVTTDDFVVHIAVHDED